MKTLQKLPVTLRIESELFAVSRTNRTVPLLGVFRLLFFYLGHPFLLVAILLRCHHIRVISFLIPTIEASPSLCHF